jgi:hypothetical protein
MMTTYYFLRQGQDFQRISLNSSPPGVIEVRNIGPIPANCKVNVSFDFNLDNLPSIFCHEQINGDLFIYFADATGNYVKGPTFGRIGPEWQLQVCRFAPSTGALGANIFGHNRDPRHPDYQKIMVWHTTGADLTTPVEFGKIGTEWDLMLGDFNRDGILDIFGRRTITNSEGQAGDLKVWFTEYVGGLPRITESPFGNIGLEWQLQVADMNGDGYADVFGYTANNDLYAWYNSDDGRGGRRLDDGHDYGKFGTEWQSLQVAYLNDDGYPDILGQATNGRIGQIGGWFTDGRAITNPLPYDLGFAPSWISLAGVPQTRVV